MKLKDVLALPKSKDSIELLKIFLNNPLSYHDYMAAFLHYIGILFHIEALDILIIDTEIVISKFDMPNYDLFMDQTYHIYIDALILKEDFEKAKTYINKRKEKLTYIDRHKVFLQEYAYITKLNLDVYAFIESILDMPMPDETYRFFTSHIIHILISEQKFTEAHVILLKMEEKLGQTDLELKLSVLSGLKEFDQMLTTLLPLQKNMTPMVLYYFMVSYVGLKSYQKAINLEVEYEQLMEIENPYQLSFYEILLSMYKTLKNTISIKEYEQRIKNYQASLKKKQKTIESKKQVTSETISVKEPLNVSVPKSLETYEKMTSFLQKMTTLDLTEPFRDILRHLGMISQRLTPFSTLVFYMKHEKTLYFFKKDRLYDKKLKPQQLEHTMINYVEEQRLEGHLDIHQFEHKKDVVTELTYQGLHHMYTYSNEDVLMFAYYVEEDKVYASEDDILRVVFMNSILMYQFKNQLNIHKYEADLNHFMLKHPHVIMRIHSDGRSIFSNQAKRHFEVEDDISLNDFLDILPVSLRSQYQEHMTKLYSLSVLESSFEFQIGEKLYKEYSIVHNYDLKPLIISVFEDFTEVTHEKQDVMLHAHTDLITQLPNITAFQHEFKSLIKEKITFLKVELSKHIQYLYGQKNYFQYFKEFAHLTKKVCESEGVYIVDHHHILVILPYNDIRTVMKTVKVYMDKVLSWIPKSIPQEPFMPFLGALRYPVVTNDTRVDVILSYLDIALAKASQQSYPFMHDFQYQDFESDQKEQYILDQIHEAITHKQFSIGFHQIIHQTQNKVWMYESFAYIPHLDVDEKDIKRIAKKRKRIFELDIAHVERVCIMLKSMFDATGKYIKILIPIDKETLIHHLSMETLSQLFQTYHIPPHIIHLNIDGDFKASVHSVLFEDIKRLGIDIHVSSLKTALYYPCEALHFDIKRPDAKMIAYLKTIQGFCRENQMDFVIRNVTTKEIKQQLFKESIDCIEGPIYKKLTQEALFNKVIQT
jgi:EAL domain-containing protein (putative c-di-GMP-specific phosphodiesterase class I)/tetratricopeptide (TPR) repeat protein